MKKFKSALHRLLNGDFDEEAADLFMLRLLALGTAAASLSILVRYLLEPSNVNWGIHSSIGMVVAGLLMFMADLDAWRTARKKRLEKGMREANSH